MCAWLGALSFEAPKHERRKLSDQLLPWCFPFAELCSSLPARLIASAGRGRPPLRFVQCMDGAVLVHFACLGMYALAVPLHLHIGRPAGVLAACFPFGGPGGWAGPMLIFSTLSPRQVTCRSSFTRNCCACLEPCRPVLLQCNRRRAPLSLERR